MILVKRWPVLREVIKSVSCLPKSSRYFKVKSQSTWSLYHLMSAFLIHELKYKVNFTYMLSVLSNSITLQAKNKYFPRIPLGAFHVILVTLLATSWAPWSSHTTGENRGSESRWICHHLNRPRWLGQNQDQWNLCAFPFSPTPWDFENCLPNGSDPVPDATRGMKGWRGKYANTPRACIHT